MKSFLLTNGKECLISDEDYDRVISAGNWYEDEREKRSYVYRRFDGKKVYLHKFILEYEGPDDIDHDDGNGLNCQRENMIIKTRTFNNLNNHNIRSDNKSGRRGVYWDTFYCGWKAEFKIHGKKYNLGVYTDLALAIRAREIAEDRVNCGMLPK